MDEWRQCTCIMPTMTPECNACTLNQWNKNTSLCRVSYLGSRHDATCSRSSSRGRLLLSIDIWYVASACVDQYLQPAPELSSKPVAAVVDRRDTQMNRRTDGRPTVTWTPHRIMCEQRHRLNTVSRLLRNCPHLYHTICFENDYR